MTNTRKWIEQLDTSEMKKILEVPPQAKGSIPDLLVL